MAKTKQRQPVAVTANENNASSGIVDSLNSDTDLDLHVEKGWVIVKKQRITILVPSLPTADRSPQQNPGPSHLQEMPGNIVKCGLELRTATCPIMPSADEQRKSMSSVPKKGVQLARNSSQNISTLTKPFKQDSRMESRMPHQVHSLKSHKVPGVSKTSKTLVRTRLLLHGPNDFYGGGGMPLNQRLRALNLERRIQKAGGLSSWLASLGLGQFVKLFQRKGLNKFQLVNLNMKKLKDMGAVAVGPRRKLMHAIDCICQPHCFEAF
ncbi:hypothetical protein FEM48_Zijuj12G0075700 [Ziziphus jujuba var. spinosa]|uniref:SAM domain-containing protein n=1 Tax=Ziziphus jujuba var. spinosa TaxID=714518 RepID=A0A978UC04_ZIZJJ|nr:hypothetical protein FEM48_Zijuj12G0075700 [Ziziphus jujuba var. spinosa]